jgi:TP901 family phage tail tape measure protein
VANDLIFAIVGNDRSKQAFASVSNSLKTTMGSVSEAQRKLTAFGRSAATAGGVASAGVTAPLLAAAKSIATVAGGFEAGMNRVQALSDATGAEFEALRSQAKELGATTAFSARQAADAMGFLAMAGFSATETLGAMPGTLQLAAAAQMDLATTADIVSNVLTGFSKPVSELAVINDVLVKTMTSTNTDLRMLGDAFKYVGPVASAAGAEFNEVAAAIGLLGNAGIQGEMAGTALRGAMSKILNPTKAARTVMAELGISLTDATGSVLPLADILDELAPHAENAGAFMELFGQRAGPAMLSLVTQGSGALRTLRDELDQAGGTAERIAKAQMQGFNGKMKEMASAFEGLQIAIADSGMLDVLTDMVKGITGIISAVASADPALLKFGTAIAAVAAIMGPLVLAGGALALFVGALSAPVVGLVAVVGLAAAAFIAFGDDIMRVGGQIVDGAVSLSEDVIAAIAGIPERLLEIGTLIARGLVRGLVRSNEMVRDAVMELGASIIRWFSDVLGIASPSRVFAELGGELLRGLVNGILEHMADVRDAIENVGSSVIGWFRERLGISSPSRVFAELGGFLMDGLARGIDAGRGTVEKAIATTGDGIVREADRATGAVRETLDTVGDTITGSLRAALKDGRADFASFADALSGIGERLRDRMIDRIFKPIEDALDRVIDRVFDGLGGGFGGGFGGGSGSFFGGLGGLFAGFFADGGTIPGGRFGIVGENGPELAFAGSGGMTIAPLPLRGGGGTVGGGGLTVYSPVTINGLGVDDVERRLIPRLEQQRRQVINDVQRAYRDNAGFLA